MKDISKAIGWIIGAWIIFPVGLYLYQKYVTLNDGYKYVDQYISNSEQINLDLGTSFDADKHDINSKAYFKSYTAGKAQQPVC